jgi:hypothetical protein
MKSFHGLLDGAMVYFFLNGDFCADRSKYYVFVNMSGCELQLGKAGNLVGGDGVVDLDGLIVSLEGFKPAVMAWIARRKLGRA